MKRISALLLIFVFVLCLSACFGKGSGSASQDISDQAEGPGSSSYDISDQAEASASAPLDTSSGDNDPAFEKDGESADKENTAEGGDAVDIDLTKLSSTMVYSEVYNILYEAEQYIGKTIRMQGQFASYFDEKESKYYTAVIISDAMACCQQGLEFVWLGHDPLDGFPKEGTLLTVTGEFEIYEEDGHKYCRISASEVTEP